MGPLLFQVLGFLTHTKQKSRFGVGKKDRLQNRPCYDFTPITNHTLGSSLPKVGIVTSGTVSFHGVTGGVYKARERIHRGMLIRDY